MAYSNWRTRPVAGIGIVGLDHVAVTDRWLPDGKSVASHYFEQVGGPVPVALMAMARLGLEIPPRFHTALGGDQDGDRILHLLTDAGIDTNAVRRLPTSWQSGHSVVVLNTLDGTRSITNLRANYFGSDVYTSLTDRSEPLIRECGLLHLDGKHCSTQDEEAVQLKSDHDALISCDLGSAPQGIEPLRSTQEFFRSHGFLFYDVLIASRHGASDCFPNHRDPLEQTRQFLDMGATIAGVTLGDQGVVIGSRDENGGEPVHLPAFPVDKVVDTCGAGDLFHGAFLWALRSGKSVIESANFAQAAVALRIQHFGNVAGQPTLEQVDFFLNACRG